jgi:hypothetical protein
MKNLVLLILLFCFSATTAFSFDYDNGSEAENAAKSNRKVSSFGLDNLGDQIMISWFSVEESDVETIELEKAENIEEFKTIRTLKGFYSKRALRYNSVDQNPVMGQNNYRLRLVKKDGSASYTDVISIGFRPVKKENSQLKQNVNSEYKKDKFNLSTTNFLNQTLILNAA